MKYGLKVFELTEFEKFNVKLDNIENWTVIFNTNYLTKGKTYLKIYDDRHKLVLKNNENSKISNNEGIIITLDENDSYIHFNDDGSFIFCNNSNKSYTYTVSGIYFKKHI
jgi:hypothetical protein